MHNGHLCTDSPVLCLQQRRRALQVCVSNFRKCKPLVGVVAAVSRPDDEPRALVQRQAAPARRGLPLQHLRHVVGELFGPDGDAGAADELTLSEQPLRNGGADIEEGGGGGGEFLGGSPGALTIIGSVPCPSSNRKVALPDPPSPEPLAVGHCTPGRFRWGSNVDPSKRASTAHTTHPARVWGGGDVINAEQVCGLVLPGVRLGESDWQ